MEVPAVFFPTGGKPRTGMAGIFTLWFGWIYSWEEKECNCAACNYFYFDKCKYP